MLSTQATKSRSEIMREVKESEVFSVIADETKDLKIKEQMSVVMRYFLTGPSTKAFYTFSHLKA